VGLIFCVAQHFGLEPIDFPVYPRVPVGQTMYRELKNRLAEKPVREARAGDVLHLEMMRELRHVGIVTADASGHPGLIHAAGLRGKVIEHRLDARWARTAYACFEFPGVVD